jgi:hypothetical protein
VTTNRGESAAERLLTVVILAVFWSAFTCLAAGLAYWLAAPAATAATHLLEAGMAGLLALPVLRLLTAVASAARTRDWMTMGATVVVLMILFALTLRDAYGLP